MVSSQRGATHFGYSCNGLGLLVLRSVTHDAGVSSLVSLEGTCDRSRILLYRLKTSNTAPRPFPSLIMSIWTGVKPPHVCTNSILLEACCSTSVMMFRLFVSTSMEHLELPSEIGCWVELETSSCCDRRRRVKRLNWRWSCNESTNKTETYCCVKQVHEDSINMKNIKLTAAHGLRS